MISILQGESVSVKSHAAPTTQMIKLYMDKILVNSPIQKLFLQRQEWCCRTLFVQKPGLYFKILLVLEWSLGTTHQMDYKK